MQEVVEEFQELCKLFILDELTEYKIDISKTAFLNSYNNEIYKISNIKLNHDIDIAYFLKNKKHHRLESYFNKFDFKHIKTDMIVITLVSDKSNLKVSLNLKWLLSKHTMYKIIENEE